MPSFEIQSPRPVRCLKRKVSQLDNTLDEGRANRRLHSWLEGVRSRSDSFLFSPKHRKQPIQPESMAHPRTTMMSPPTPQSSEPGPQDFTQQPMSTSFIDDASRPDTPAQSILSHQLSSLQ